jgi:hypothetical protein
MVIGEGIFLNQTGTAGNSKSLKGQDMSTWKAMVSRALLYRVHPEFDPPYGYSGVALYAEGMREDGTNGPGIIGFQSFVQRSGHVQNFNMQGPTLDRRLQIGRVAFCGRHIHLWRSSRGAVLYAVPTLPSVSSQAGITLRINTCGESTRLLGNLSLSSRLQMLPERFFHVPKVLTPAPGSAYIRGHAYLGDWRVLIEQDMSITIESDGEG